MEGVDISPYAAIAGSGEMAEAPSLPSLSLPLRLLLRLLPWVMLFVLLAGLAGGLRLMVALNQPFTGIALSWRKELRQYAISNVTPPYWPGLAAGLQINDRLLCVAGYRLQFGGEVAGRGQPFDAGECPQGVARYSSVLAEQVQAGHTRVDMLVGRGQQTLLVPAVPIVRFSLFQLLETYLPTFLSGLGLLIVGYVVFRAQASAEVNLVFGLFATFSAAMMMEHSYATIIGPWFEDTWWVTLILMVPTLPLLGVSLFHLTNLLTGEGGWRRAGRWLLKPFYLLAFAFMALGVFIYLFHNSPISAPYDPYFLEWCLFSALFAMVWSSIGLVWTLLRSPERRIRRQAAVILLGVLALLGFVIPYIIFFLTDAPGPSLMNGVPYVALLFVAAIAYAILRYQVFASRERILTALMVVILCIVVANVVYWVIGRGVGFVPILAAALLVGLALEARRGPTAFLNRLLRREMLDFQTVASFSRAVGGLQGPPALVATAQQAFRRDLDAEFADVWLLDADQKILERYTDGAGVSAETLAPELAAALLAHSEPNEAVKVDGHGELLPPPDRPIALWVPLVERSQAVGMVGLGARWTGDVYGEQDRQLAGILARQMALALLNTRQLERLQATSRLVWQAEENERRKIARELHDTILQFLLVLTYGLDELKDRPLLPAADIDRWQDRISAEANQLRALLNYLRAPELLVKDGLIPSLGHWLDQARRDTALIIEASLAPEIEPLLSTEAKVAFYRTCREAVHNALKHSGGHRVTVRLSQESDQVVLTVADDGQGFDAAQAWEGGDKGFSSLQDMRLHMESAGGRLEVRSAAGEGTTVRGWAPVGRGD